MHKPGLPYSVASSSLLLMSYVPLYTLSSGLIKKQRVPLSLSGIIYQFRPIWVNVAFLADCIPTQAADGKRFV